MRKLTLITLFLFVISIGLLKAQTAKGNVLLGASSSLNLTSDDPDADTDIMGIGFTTVKQKSDAQGFNEPDPDKITSFNLSPKVGYFVIDNLALGLDFSYALSKYRNGQNDNKNTASLFSVGPFIRYYYPTSRVLPFAELNGAFGTLKKTFESDAFDNVTKYNVTTLGVGVGIAAPLGEKITFDVSAVYSSTTVKQKDDNPNNVRTVTGAFGLKLGFTFFFGSSVN